MTHRAMRDLQRTAARSPAVAPVDCANGSRRSFRTATRPRVMLVGQAPGQVEAAGGRPFAGRAGKTLFRWLERAGVDEATFAGARLHRRGHSLLSGTEPERSRRSSAVATKSRSAAARG